MLRKTFQKGLRALYGLVGYNKDYRIMLNRYRESFHPKFQASQGGEDGILAEVFRRLNIKNGFFVEFGAGDGIHLSNTYTLRLNGWRGVYIEASDELFALLTTNIDNKHIVLMHAFITADGDTSIDSLLSRTNAPQDLDFMSIDIDGNDYWIWKSIEKYYPKVIAIEYNSNFYPYESKTIPYKSDQHWDGTMYFGASAAALVKLGQLKGYTFVAFTVGLNLIFVRNDLVRGRFRAAPISAVRKLPEHVQMRRDEFIDV